MNAMWLAGILSAALSSPQSVLLLPVHGAADALEKRAIDEAMTSAAAESSSSRGVLLLSGAQARARLRGRSAGSPSFVHGCPDDACAIQAALLVGADAAIHARREGDRFVVVAVDAFAPVSQARELRGTTLTVMGMMPASIDAVLEHLAPQALATRADLAERARQARASQDPRAAVDLLAQAVDAAPIDDVSAELLLERARLASLVGDGRSAWRWLGARFGEAGEEASLLGASTRESIALAVADHWRVEADRASLDGDDFGAAQALLAWVEVSGAGPAAVLRKLEAADLFLEARRPVEAAAIAQPLRDDVTLALEHRCAAADTMARAAQALWREAITTSDAPAITETSPIATKSLALPRTFNAYAEAVDAYAALSPEQAAPFSLQVALVLRGYGQLGEAEHRLAALVALDVPWAKRARAELAKVQAHPQL